MITYQFTATEEGMNLASSYDHGWLKHLDCSGKGGWTEVIPYKSGVATIYFAHPYCFTVVGKQHTQEVELLHNYNASPISKHYEGNTFVVSIDRQPPMYVNSPEDIQK
jgi:hypothetical protein